MDARCWQKCAGEVIEGGRLAAPKIGALVLYTIATLLACDKNLNQSKSIINHYRTTSCQACYVPQPFYGANKNCMNLSKKHTLDFDTVVHTARFSSGSLFHIR